MNMKRFLLLLTTAALTLSLAACGGEEKPEAPGDIPNPAPKAANAGDEIFNTLGGLIGQGTQAVEDAFGKGKELMQDAGNAVVGKEHEISLFGETLKMTPDYDANGNVSTVTISLSDTNFEKWKENIKGALGDPSEDRDGQSVWQKGNTYFTLLRNEDKLELRVTPPPVG